MYCCDSSQNEDERTEDHFGNSLSEPLTRSHLKTRYGSRIRQSHQKQAIQNDSLHAIGTFKLINSGTIRYGVTLQKI